MGTAISKQQCMNNKVWMKLMKLKFNEVWNIEIRKLFNMLTDIRMLGSHDNTSFNCVSDMNGEICKYWVSIQDLNRQKNTNPP